MFQRNHNSPWTVIGVVSWSNFLYLKLKLKIYIRINYILQQPKLQDVLGKDYPEFTLESIPTMIGSNRKWPLNRVAISQYRNESRSLKKDSN